MNQTRVSSDGPRIAILLDENTSGDASRYELGKGYFEAILGAGGAPFGVPYAPRLTSGIARSFDGLLSPGGRFAYPDDWYVDGRSPANPPSGRLAVERALMAAFLGAGKPVLGICAGMQTLACLSGCRLTANLTRRHSEIDHDGAEVMHPVSLCPGARLTALIGRPSLVVNSFHREAVASLGRSVRASAYAPDGVIEAIELADHPFALGLQWHQERFVGAAHPGNRVFAGFVEACLATAAPRRGERLS